MADLLYRSTAVKRQCICQAYGSSFPNIEWSCMARCVWFGKRLDSLWRARFLHKPCALQHALSHHRLRRSCIQAYLLEACSLIGAFASPTRVASWQHRHHWRVEPSKQSRTIKYVRTTRVRWADLVGPTTDQKSPWRPAPLEGGL